MPTDRNIIFSQENIQLYSSPKPQYRSQVDYVAAVLEFSLRVVPSES